MVSDDAIKEFIFLNLRKTEGISLTKQKPSDWICPVSTYGID